ncbi:MAG: response regulator [Candidatus Schekmanbacteria bacterium]|nr:response regulator [Candidatus Schekmanbacteria bacterium]
MDARDVNILVVDREEDLRYALAFRLRSVGYRVYEASDDKTARTQFERHLIHLVVLDAFTAEQEALALAEHFRSAQPETQILILVPFDAVPTRERAAEIGIAEVMVKPVSARQLMTTIAGALRKRFPEGAFPGQPAILIVDDEEDVRFMLAFRLRYAGYSVAEAKDGAQALSMIHQTKYDVVILDVMMPRMDGFEVLRRLQTVDEHPAVIFLTAVTQLEDRVRGLELGAVDYVAKPFDLEEVVARVGVALREKTRLEGANAASLEDPLTLLGNRRAFTHALEKEISRAIRFERRAALIAIDADGLKRINDAAGHEAGDRYLRAISAAIRATCRRVDSAFRVGGDEFAVVLTESDRAAAERFCSRFAEALAERPLAEGISVSASCGIAVFPEDGRCQATLIEAADRMLYASKRKRV